MGATRAAVLVTDGGAGGSRDCLVAVRALAAAGYRADVTVSPGSTSRQAVSRYATKRFRVPPVAEAGYVEAIRRLAARESHLTVLAVSEASLVALGGEVPHLSDKLSLEAAAESAGIPTPSSETFDSPAELVEAGSRLPYPVAVKPLTRTYTAFRADSSRDLTRAEAAAVPVMVQPWIAHQPRAVSGVMWGGRLVAAAHERWLRVWPYPAGLACAAETTTPDAALEARLERLLSGYDGLFCAQLAGDFLIDLNLRVHSSHPLAVAAGVNLVAVYCDLVGGAEPGWVRARPGYFYRWLEGDVRHVVKAWRTGRMGLTESLLALRPRRGTAHSTESLADPGPMLVRLAYGLRRAHLSEDERRAGAIAPGAERLAGREVSR